VRLKFLQRQKLPNGQLSPVHDAASAAYTESSAEDG